MKITRKFYGQNITFLLPDGCSTEKCERMVLSTSAWLGASKGILTTAITRASAAMVHTNNMSEMHKQMMFMYFNIPLTSSDAVYKNALNKVVQVLNATLRGLSKPTLTFADISQMPGLARLHCGLTFQKTSSFAGLVYEGPAEFLKNRLSLKEHAPIGAVERPLEGYINLNYELFFKQGDVYSIVTVIHEATHKFGRTTDLIYFDPKEGKTQFEAAMDNLAAFGPMRTAGLDVSDQEAKVVNDAVRDAHAAKKSKIDSGGLMNNADSFANYAFDAARYLVQDFPTRAPVDG